MSEKLMIAIPTLDYIHHRFVKSLLELTKYLSDVGVDYDVCFEGCTLVYISRDNLARKAIKEHYDRVLWLDADMIFDFNLYHQLLSTKKDFVTGFYRGRHGTKRPCLFESLVPSIRMPEFEKGTFQIKGCGFGCVLIKTDILKDVMEEHDTCFTPTPEFGEDVMFCKRAYELGHEIWATDRVQAGHIGQMIIYPDQERNQSI